VNPDCGFGHAGYPAICLTAHAGNMYCQWLSQKTGRKYRLPTPAEWQYACRAGGPELKANGDIAWTSENSPNQSTQPVAKKKPNAFGLYDMLGNVGEWTITADGKNELLCGGHFLQSAKEITSATREQLNANWFLRAPANPPSKWWLSDGQFCGFRVVREE
jgi:formylglycine-generating enzyme required for sulfatase activity